MKRNAFIALIAVILLSGCPVLNTGPHNKNKGDGGAKGPYTVVFDKNGGKGTNPDSETEEAAGSGITLPDDSGFSREGYSFLGWNTEADGSGDHYDADDEYFPTSTHKLYAEWGAVYRVSFNVNGGEGTTPDSQMAADGTAITLPDGSGLSRDNYQFGGWNTNAAGTGGSYAGGGFYTVSVGVTLYAVWVAEAEYVEGDFTFYGALSYTLTGYSGSGGAVSIPAMANGKPVVAIAGGTIAGGNWNSGVFINKKLTSVTIPDSVTSIGGWAFRQNQLTSVSIPDSVTEIGQYAFFNNQLASVTIPNSVTTIEQHAFQNNQLTSLSIGNSVTTIGDYAFDDNQLTSVTIADSVTEIGKYAFSRNQLTSVTIGSSVIGDYAFSDNSLTSLSIGSSVTKIGFMAFRNNLLTSVIIPDSVTLIDQYAFQNNQLTSVTISDSVIAFGPGAFSNNPLISITIGADKIIYPPERFGNGFETAYNNGGKLAGTYTRPNVDSTEWTKQ